MIVPTTRYARSGDASIAYQVVGDGPLDLLFLTGWVTQLEQLWEAPANRRFLERLATFGRLIMFDSRGTGLSERVLETYTIKREAQDALAVLDAASSERAALFTYAQGGLVGAHLAAEHPGRIGALIMYASIARTSWAPDYPWAMTSEEREALSERNIASWGEENSDAMSAWAPTMASDPALVTWFARMQRLAASPGEARVITRAMVDVDVRPLLPRIRMPTLIMHRPNELVWDVRHSHYLAANIQGARYVELEGVDSFPFIGDSDAIVEEVEEFLTGVRGGGELTRALLTVMFTDIVDATAHAARVGDKRWRDLLAQHDREVRQELARFGGREVKTVGDGFLATFDGPPSRALHSALAITVAARRLGVEVRVGMHTGECELIGEDVGGMAVHIASRVSARAGAGEVLVSGTVFGTVVGGPFTFEDRGRHELKGVPGHWPLFSLGA
ncbi:MAG TPA: adenylate/guanylate cyclase domain-containing protein [Solirubrobacteraceae bacterium]|jgi:class 3 adenylate cyclase/pimeloyl-ACP methyl ester carboxylesterase|nr:adenylate/guanylate cyclase domain-containing protein [Solirubrobacteraceae bacterium]